MDLNLYVFTSILQEEPWAIEIVVDSDETVEAVAKLVHSHLKQKWEEYVRDNGQPEETN